MICLSFPDWVEEPDHYNLPDLETWRLSCPEESQMSHKYSFQLFSPHKSKSNTFPLPLVHSSFCTCNTPHQTCSHLPPETWGNIYRGFFVPSFSFSHEIPLQLLGTSVMQSTFQQADFRKSRESKSFQKEQLFTSVSALLVMTKCRHKCTKNC